VAAPRVGGRDRVTAVIAHPFHSADKREANSCPFVVVGRMGAICATAAGPVVIGVHSPRRSDTSPWGGRSTRGAVGLGAMMLEIRLLRRAEVVGVHLPDSSLSLLALFNIRQTVRVAAGRGVVLLFAGFEVVRSDPS